MHCGCCIFHTSQFLLLWINCKGDSLMCHLVEKTTTCISILASVFQFKTKQKKKTLLIIRVNGEKEIGKNISQKIIKWQALSLSHRRCCGKWCTEQFTWGLPPLHIYGCSSKCMRPTRGKKLLGWGRKWFPLFHADDPNVAHHHWEGTVSILPFSKCHNINKV